jgi:hypothetical protein
MYMKLFKKLLNATVLNAMIIYRHNTRKQINQLAFRVNLMEALFQQFADTERKVPCHQAAENIIYKVPSSGGKSAPQRWVVCTKYGWMKDIRFFCLQCVRLCLEEWFETKHTFNIHI